MVTITGFWSITALTDNEFPPDGGEKLSYKQHALGTFRIEGEIKKDGVPATTVGIWRKYTWLVFPQVEKFTQIDCDGNGKFSAVIKFGVGTEETLTKAKQYTFACYEGTGSLDKLDGDKYLEWVKRPAAFIFTEEPITELLTPVGYSFMLRDDLTKWEIYSSYKVKRLWGADSVGDCKESAEWSMVAGKLYFTFAPASPQMVYGKQFLKWIWDGNDLYESTDLLRWDDPITGDPAPAVSALEIMVGTLTEIVIEDITSEDKPWNEEVSFSATLRHPETEETIMKSFHVSIKYDGTTYWEDDWVGTDTKSFTPPNTWIDEKVTIEATFTGSTAIAPYYIPAEKMIEFSVRKRLVELSITTPSEYIPSGETEPVPVGEAIWEIPLGSKATYVYTLMDVSGETPSPLSGKTINLKWIKGETEITDSVVTEANGSKSKEWTFSSGEGFSVGAWTQDAAFVEESDYERGSDYSLLTISKEPPKFEYSGPTTLVVGSEGTFIWTLKRTSNGDPIVGEDIMVTWRGGEHTDFGLDTTDVNGKVTYTWTPTSGEIGDTTLQATYEEDTYARRVDIVRTVTVPKLATEVTLTGPATLVIDGRSTYTGTLTETVGSAAVPNALIDIYQNKSDWEAENPPWKSDYTDDTGDYVFTWTPKIAEVDTYNLFVRFEGDSTHEPCDDEKSVTVEKKTSSISAFRSDTVPVPSSEVKIYGYLLPEQMILKEGETISLMEGGSPIDTTVTNDMSRYEFSLTPSTGSHDYTTKWAGDTEWKEVTSSNQNVTVQKETPLLLESLSRVITANKKFIVSSCIVSWHGADVNNLTLKIYAEPAHTLIATDQTDTKGFWDYEHTAGLATGDYTWRLQFDGNTQLNSFYVDETFSSIAEPDYTRPKFKVKLFDHDNVEKGISPLDKIASLKVTRSTAPEADTFALVLDNKDSYFSDKVLRGDLISIALAYEPSDFAKIPIAIKGVVEDANRRLSSKAESLGAKGQDFTLYLKNRRLERNYTLQSPAYLLEDATYNIFKLSGLDTKFDFDITAPSGWPYRTNWSFDKKSILDCLKTIRDKCYEFTGIEYEFYVESDETKPLLVFKPKATSFISTESLEVGVDVMDITIKEEISTVKNKIKIEGAKLPTLLSEPEQYTLTGTETIMTLAHGEITNFFYLTIDGQAKEMGVDFDLDPQLGILKLVNPYPTNTELEVNYEYLKRIECKGGEVFTGTGSQTAFTLAYTPVETVYFVTVDGVEQSDPTDYSIVKSTGVVTFVTAPADDADILISYSYDVATVETDLKWWMDTASMSLNEERHLAPDPVDEIETVEELDRLARTILLMYRKPTYTIKVKTPGLFQSEAGSRVHLKYTSESIDKDFKIVELSQSFTKGSGFSTTLSLEERTSSLGEIIARIIEGTVSYVY